MNIYFSVSLILLSLFAVISMILAITVSPYFWIPFVIFLLILLPILWLWIRKKWTGKYGGYSPSSGSESSLDGY